MIFIGSKAQLVLQKYLFREPESSGFSPRASEQLRRAELTSNRKTPINQGNRPGDNRKKNPSIAPGDQYTTASYRRAKEAMRQVG